MPLCDKGQDAAEQIRKRKDVEKTGKVADDRRLPADPATLEVGDAKAGQALPERCPEESLEDRVVANPQQRQPRPIDRRLCRELGTAAAPHRARESARNPGNTE